LSRVAAEDTVGAVLRTSGPYVALGLIIDVLSAERMSVLAMCEVAKAPTLSQYSRS
jgi:hypothetical protein